MFRLILGDLGDFMGEDEFEKLLRRRLQPEGGPEIPAELASKLVKLREELDALSKLIHDLSVRLAAGENSVRAELNPAIRRRLQLMSDIRELERNAGLPDPPQVMYGPPWRGPSRE